MKVVWKLSVDENITIKSQENTIKVAENLNFVIGNEYFYCFSWFALQLNLPNWVYSELPETDSRFRKDVRALENGNVKEAENEYENLTMKNKIDSKGPYKPKWFVYNDDKAWEYNGNYW